MISYGGIGSRQITAEEEQLIQKIAGKLSDAGMILYSGNAEGSDIAFQRGSKGKCVLLLPWKKFNRDKYDLENSLAYIDVGKTKEGIESVAKYHPAPKALSFGGQCMMARNYHQIMGIESYSVAKNSPINNTQIDKIIYPVVSFVVCCSNRDENGKIVGGTGQACRIAADLGIPVFNIRDSGWETPFADFLNKLKTNS
jgi:hypothetical protein